MEPAIPIPTLHLFPILDKMLIELLASLSSEEWHKSTIARLWIVKDIAAHLLDGNVRGIAILNGHEAPPPAKPINNYQDLVEFLNQLNSTWINAMKRVSPQLLTQQLEDTGKSYLEYLKSLKPFEQAKFSVAWAGEETSLNWFHVAREYTEKWHHQQQIRDAVGKPGIITKELFLPCMDIFMRSLPYTYRDIKADAGTMIEIIISGDVGGNWYLQKTSDGWQLSKEALLTNITSAVILSPDTAWKLFTKAISPLIAMGLSTIKGNTSLAKTVFNTIAVMA